MYSALDIGNTILQHSFARNIPTNHAKLQYLMFIMESEYAYRSDRELVGNWLVQDYGPYQGHVKFKLDCMGSQPIEKYLRDASDNPYVISRGDSTLDAIVPIINSINSAHTSSSLLHIMRAPGTAWRKAWVNRQTRIDHDVIVESVDAYRPYLGISY